MVPQCMDVSSAFLHGLHPCKNVVRMPVQLREHNEHGEELVHPVIGNCYGSTTACEVCTEKQRSTCARIGFRTIYGSPGVMALRHRDACILIFTHVDGVMQHEWRATDSRQIRRRRRPRAVPLPLTRWCAICQETMHAFPSPGQLRNRCCRMLRAHIQRHHPELAQATCVEAMNLVDELDAAGLMRHRYLLRNTDYLGALAADIHNQWHPQVAARVQREAAMGMVPATDFPAPRWPMDD